MFLLKESLRKIHVEVEHIKTIHDMIFENNTLRKVLSQSSIGGKFLDILIRNSRNLHDKQVLDIKKRSYM